MQRDELEAGLELAPQKMKLKTKLLITAAALAVLCIAVLASFLYGAVKGAEKLPPSSPAICWANSCARFRS